MLKDADAAQTKARTAAPPVLPASDLILRLDRAAARLCGGYYEPRTEQEGLDGALFLEAARRIHALEELLNPPQGQCLQGDRCACGGDVPAIRVTCSQWVYPAKQMRRT